MYSVGLSGVTDKGHEKSLCAIQCHTNASHLLFYLGLGGSI